MTLSFAAPGHASTRVSARLGRLVEALASFEHEPSLDAIVAAVVASKIQRVDVAPYLSLQANRYCHQRVYRSPLVEVGCIGWLPGQQTPVHHHAGSSCCVLVLDGVLTNVEFACTEQPTMLRTRTLRQGEMLAYRGHELHRMSNDARGAELFTLHVYSPPLAPMRHRTTAQPPTLKRRKS